jgi:hypothetical protein
MPVWYNIDKEGERTSSKEKVNKMTDITKNLIKRAIRVSFPDVNANDIYFQGDEGFFRDWSYSKDTEDIYPEERDAEYEACKKFNSLVPGYEIERGDKNYFEIYNINV